MRILLADGDASTRETLTALLEAAGYEVEAAADGHAAVKRAARGGLDLLLLDAAMPRMGGAEACRILKQMHGLTSFLPIVLLALRTDSASRIEGISSGADDFILKPLEKRDVLDRVAAMLRVKRMQDDMRAARMLLEKVSIRDELTNLHNHRFLLTRLAEVFLETEKKQTSFACCLFDVDRLKVYNERVGRSFGDKILKHVADVVRAAGRATDTAVRYGEDEFMLLLPDTHFTGAVKLAEAVWRAVGEKKWLSPAGECDVSLSIGVALFPSRDVRAEGALLKCADLALARAKRDGMNRICVFQQHGLIYTPHAAAGCGAEGWEVPSARFVGRKKPGERP